MKAKSGSRLEIAEGGLIARHVMPNLYESRMKHTDIDGQAMQHQKIINRIAEANANKSAWFVEGSASTQSLHDVRWRVIKRAKAQQPTTEQKKAEKAQVDEDDWVCHEAPSGRAFVNPRNILNGRSRYQRTTQRPVESALNAAAKRSI